MATSIDDYVLNDSQGCLSEDFIWRRFRLVKLHLKHMLRKGGEIFDLRKESETANPVIDALANGCSTDLQKIIISENEKCAVVSCLRSLCMYLYDVGDDDFAEEIDDLLHIFTQSLNKRNSS